MSDRIVVVKDKETNVVEVVSSAGPQGARGAPGSTVGFGAIEFLGHSLTHGGTSGLGYIRSTASRVGENLGVQVFDWSIPGSILTWHSGFGCGWADIFNRMNPGKAPDGGIGFPRVYTAQRDLVVFNHGFNDVGYYGGNDATVESMLPLQQAFIATISRARAASVYSFFDPTVAYGGTAVTVPGQGAGAVNAVQAIDLGGATGGTYRLRFLGVLTGHIAWDASDATIKSSLEAIAGIEVGDVTVASKVVTFTGNYAGTPIPTMELTSALTGTTSTPAVIPTTLGVPSTDYWSSYNNLKRVSAGGTITVSVPDDFPGGNIALAFEIETDGVAGGTCVSTVDGGSSENFNFENDGIGFAPFRNVAIHRRTELSPGAHTIEITVGSDYAYFDSWWIEAPNPPLVLLCEASYNTPYTETTNSRLTQVVRNAAAAFDDHVLTVVTGITEEHLTDGVHFNDLGHAQVAKAITEAALNAQRELEYHSEGNALGNPLSRSPYGGLYGSNVITPANAGSPALILQQADKPGGTVPLLPIRDRSENVKSGFDADGNVFSAGGALFRFSPAHYRHFGDLFPDFGIDFAGNIWFGPGGTVFPDISLARTEAGRMEFAARVGVDDPVDPGDAATKAYVDSGKGKDFGTWYTSPAAAIGAAAITANVRYFIAVQILAETLLTGIVTNCTVTGSANAKGLLFDAAGTNVRNGTGTALATGGMKLPFTSPVTVAPGLYFLAIVSDGAPTLYRGHSWLPAGNGGGTYASPAAALSIPTNISQVPILSTY